MPIRPIADVIRGMERAYDRFPVHVMVNVKEQRVEVTVGRGALRTTIVFHHTEGDRRDTEGLVDAALTIAGCRRKGEGP